MQIIYERFFIEWVRSCATLCWPCLLVRCLVRSVDVRFNAPWYWNSLFDNDTGFNDQEIVALSGAHALGRCHTTASGYDGPWTPTPTTFNNVYFTLLKNLPWKKREWDGPFQYEDGGKRLMMLPTDLVLIQDKSFAKYIDLYARDGKKFEKDFSDAFHKLEELGTTNLVPREWV